MKTEQISSEELAARIAAFTHKVLTEPVPKPKPAPKAAAEVVAGPWPRPKLSEVELIRRQAQIDWWWERRLVEERQRRAADAKHFHRGRGDPDFDDGDDGPDSYSYAPPCGPALLVTQCHN